MKLKNDFPELKSLKERMKAKDSDWRPGVNSLDPLEELRRELEEGKEIPPSDVETSNGGLLSYKGEQVVLYIKNTRLSRYVVENEPENSRRFHLTDCKTLDLMRDHGRFEEHYVATNRKTGIFSVTSTDPDTQEVEELEATLLVCKNCLRNLNWGGYEQASRAQRETIWSEFSMEDFFAEYATFFRQKPIHTDQTAPIGGYVKEWSALSRKIRAERNWTCEGDDCGVQLEDHKSLLHCHHKNGNIRNNARSNIVVLCKLCHSQQPLHSRVKPTSRERLIIENKRRQRL